MFKLIDAFFAFVLLGLLILVGRLVRQRLGILKRLYLPSSIVAGVIGLLLGPGVLGAIAQGIAGPGTLLADGLIPETTRQIWSQSPGVFINIVFATLFLGEHIPSPGDIWRKASPQVAFGQSLAWGQYVVGLLIALLILVPVFKMDPIAGTLIEVAFEGGHGTAAGMAPVYEKLNFPNGADLALGLATVGIVSGLVAGTLLADWGRRQGHIATIEPPKGEMNLVETGLPHEDAEMRRARQQLTHDLLIDPLSLNLGIVGIAVILGWLILKGLLLIEVLTWGQTGVEVINYVPLFPMTLIGGIIVQLVMVRLRLHPLIDRQLMGRIAGVALDVTVATALASISLNVLGANLGPFLLLAIAGIIWNVWAFLYLGPRLLPSYWFERGIGDMGQSMGVTATGILLIRMVDIDNRSGALESFAYKQLLFEPIVGGGLFTSIAPVLVRQFGPIPVLLLTTGILVFWLTFGTINARRINQQAQAQADRPHSLE